MAQASSLENEFLRLDVSIDPTLRISVFDKRTSFLWEHAGAPFVLHFWEARHYADRAIETCRDQGWEFRLLPNENSVSVQCTWPRAATGFRAVMLLKGPAVEVSFPGRRRVENRPFDVRQTAMDVLPGLGAARTGEPGFMLLPRGRGVLCRFDKTSELEARQLVYADGDRELAAPTFGINRGDRGFLGIVTEGEFNTEIVCVANAGPERNLNFLYPRLRLRFHPGDPADEDFDCAVSYTFLAGPDSSWVGMAKTYRSHLLTTLRQPSLAERLKRRPLLAYAAAAPALHLHLAEKRRLTSMSGDGELVLKTRFEEAAQTVKAMKAAGIDTAVVVLVGWNCEGRDGLYPTRFPVESIVGGADSMGRTVAAIKAAGYQPGALDNYTDAYRRSPAFNEDTIALQPGGEPWRGGVWAGGQSYVICPSQALERYAQRDMRRLFALGLQGMLFLDHCPGPGALSCYSDKHPLTRAEYGRAVVELIRAAQSTFGLCRVATLSAFAALAADSCLVPVRDIPRVDGLGGDWPADETVPFLPVALHGVILMAGEAGTDLLRVVEYGASPLYSATAADAAQAVEKMKEFWPRYTRELAPLACEFIEAHETPAEGLVKVQYSNGKCVLINRTGQPDKIDGVTVGPGQFEVR